MRPSRTQTRRVDRGCWTRTFRGGRRASLSGYCAVYGLSATLRRSLRLGPSLYSYRCRSGRILDTTRWLTLIDTGASAGTSLCAVVGYSSDRESRGMPRGETISAPDLYRILGLHRRASDRKIKATYRKLAKRLHPDVNASETATERLIEINRAYQILGDPDAREAYDAELALERSEARGRFWRGVAAGVGTFILTVSSVFLGGIVVPALSRPATGWRRSSACRKPERRIEISRT